ncbi:MAG TPA: hypothetical protein VG324_10040 [Blastocatellia bacterium]|nr:hypothetical protein [Blastocatellia bacterium]
MDNVPPVAYASSFTVGILSPLPNARDGIGRRKDERADRYRSTSPSVPNQPLSKSDAETIT